MDNPELVEEYPREFETTQFEKVLVAAKRAKDLHNQARAPLIESERKIPYVALQEVREAKINPAYRKEPVELIGEEGDDNEEEE
jgi:DNA-directed RNA polymerase subunit K/omega